MSAQGQAQPARGSLVERLSRMLDTLDQASAPAQAADAAPEPPPVPPEVRQRLQDAESVLRMVTTIVGAIKERIDLLDAVCQAIGTMAPRAVRVHPKLAFYEPRLRALVEADATAARLVGSVVGRYREVHAETAALHAMVEAGEVTPGAVEKLKGKYLFLCNIQVYFKDFPLLNHVFNPNKPVAPAPAAKPDETRRRYGLYDGSAPAPQGSRAIPGTPGAAPARPAGAPRPVPRLTGPLPLPPTARPATVPLAGDSFRKGTQQVVAAAAAAEVVCMPRGPDEEALVAQAAALVTVLRPKLAIVRAAIAPPAAAGKGGTAPLPGPARRTAEAIGEMVAADPDLGARLKRVIAIFDDLRAQLRRPAVDAARMRRAVMELGALPATFREVAWLGRLMAPD